VSSDLADAAAPTEAPAATVRWRLDLAYDGTDFAGWARQDGQRTVQEELETWIGRVLRLDEPPRLVCAGRTDAGVHARGQVAHVDLARSVVADDGTALLRRLRRAVPVDLAVRRVIPAPAGFDARFAAIWRRYVYRLNDPSNVLDPLLRHQVTAVRGVLDLDLFNAAAQTLIGLRDFGAFCRRREGATTIRTLVELRAERVATGLLAGVVECTVRADAFCHSMVRSVVGALVSVASGQRDLAWLTGVTRAAVRDARVPVLPPGGLTLEEVGYPPDDQLATRSFEARAVRELS